MATPFTIFTGSDLSVLTGSLLAANSGITIDNNSIVLRPSAETAVNFYDGSLSPLGIGAGLLLTSGTMPGTTNTVGWFGTDNSFSSGFDNGDADINGVVNTVFQTQSYDATTLAFDFTVTDPSATSISFDIVFGSDEYPEWVDQFVDCAVVMVNGVNYALFNHDPNHPLSVVSSNLAAGYFQDNGNNVLPIEYDGVSHVLKIVAPISGGINHIKIGIADTGDHIYDSGIFISNLSAGNIPGSGVVSSSNSGTDNSDSITGTVKDEYFDLKAGNDTCYAGAGDDIIVAGAGNDLVYGGSGNDEMKGDGGDDLLDGGDGLSDTAVYAGNSADYSVVFNPLNGGYTVSNASEGTDTVIGVEQAKFSNGLFALTPSGLSAITNTNQPPTNTPGSIFISGIGSIGNTLTATVSDPDGISGAISYQWQISGDNGASWSNVGNDSQTYTVTGADAGSLIQVVASYTDGGSVIENPLSTPKAILALNNGDLVVTLMQLTSPSGASTINPLTTLIQDAIDLGLSPNLAALSVKNVLGIPAGINLQNYDAYGVLQTNPINPTALQVEKLAVQVAILTSLSDDDTGINLTSKIIEAAQNNQGLNLANANDLASILGLDITGLTKNNYPQPLKEIFDRNKSMSDAIADGGDVSVIEQEWQDLLSIQDGINSTSIADLSIHINQAPTGTPTAALAQGTEGSSYTLIADQLLQGFSDSDGGILSLSDLSLNIAGSLTDNLDGTWTFTPDANYTGPVELTYSVTDGQGGSTSASQMFVIAPNIVTPVNNAPTGTASAILANGSEDTPYTIYASDLLEGFSDVDGDTLSISGLTADNGSLQDNQDGTWTFTPNQDFSGTVNLNYTVIDNQGGSVLGSQSFYLDAVNDAPSISLSNTTTNTPENSTITKVANITITDDQLGTNTLGLSGNDASFFEIVGTELRLKAGTNLDFETKNSYQVTVEVDDTTIGNNPDGSANFTLALNNVNEAPTSLSLSRTNINENVPANSTVGTLSSNDPDSGDSFTYSLVSGTGSTDNNSFTIVNNELHLNVSPDFETKASYSVRLRTTDAGGLFTETPFTITINNLSSNAITGTAADETFVATNEIDTIDASGGNDTFSIAVNYLQSGESFNGNTGLDTLSLSQGSSTSKLTLNLSATNQFVSLTGVSGITLTNVENLDLAAFKGTGNLTGDGNANSFVGGVRNDVLNGGAGNDTLIGGTGNDNLNGGADNDILKGSAGKDTLTGGTGSDRFDYKTLTDSLFANYDLIKDFNANEDKFLVTTAPTVFTKGITVKALSQTGISAGLTTSNFVNAQYVAQFSYGSRTFVAINDSVAGFQAANDTIVELTSSGLTGTLQLSNFIIA